MSKYSPPTKYLNFNKKRNRGRNVYDSAKTAVILLAPAFILMGIVVFFPLIRSIILSFYDKVLTNPDQESFVFLDNFIKVFQDSTFWIPVKNTIVFIAPTVIISLIIGMVMAIALDQLTDKFSGLRGILLIPWVIPGIVVGFLFQYMFDIDVGIINFVLQKIGLIQEFLPWLSDGRLAMIAIIIAHVWFQTPFYILMISAGLQTVAKDQQEAAYVEGASRWQEFVYVTLPSLKSILGISTLMMIIRNFNQFPIIYTMTGGGPGYSTTTAVLGIYKEAFEKYNISYAATIGVVWVLGLMLIAIFYVRSQKDDL